MPKVKTAPILFGSSIMIVMLIFVLARYFSQPFSVERRAMPDPDTEEVVPEQSPIIHKEKALTEFSEPIRGILRREKEKGVFQIIEEHYPFQAVNLFNFFLMISMSMLTCVVLFCLAPENMVRYPIALLGGITSFFLLEHLSVFLKLKNSHNCFITDTGLLFINAYDAQAVWVPYNKIIKVELVDDPNLKKVTSEGVLVSYVKNFDKELVGERDGQCITFWGSPRTMLHSDLLRDFFQTLQAKISLEAGGS